MADSTPATPENPMDIDTMPLEELARRVDRAKAIFDELRALFPGLRSLTEVDRTHSSGRMREGEATELGKVIDAIVYAPQYFTSLADEDNGKDPTRLEPDLLRERLARRDLLAQIDDELASLSRQINDTTLTWGALVRPVLLAAYQIAKPISKADQKLRDIISTVIDFYGRPARAAADTRKKRNTEAQGDK